jgi:hypothetical protein
MRQSLHLALVSLGAAVCIGGAAAFISLEASTTTGPIWPLPGLALLDWAILGFIGLLAARRGAPAEGDDAHPGPWAIGGALVSLGTVAALSIGPFVGLSALLFLAGVAFSSPPRVKVTVRDLRWFLGGLVGNLALLLLVILLAG